MQVVVQLFAGARQIAGRDRLTVEVAAPATARTLLDSVLREVPELAPLAASSRLAIGGRYATDDSPVTAESDVAWIPPVSGG